jgi:hypothetical protein
VEVNGIGSSIPVALFFPPKAHVLNLDKEPEALVETGIQPEPGPH